VIVETDIFDPEQYEQHKAASPAAVERRRREPEMVAVEGV